jgi:CubicO group peptidase (beta-lactamase class C family)
MTMRVLWSCLLLTAASLAVADPPDAYVLEMMEQYEMAGTQACCYYGDSLIWEGSFGTINFEYTDSLVDETTLFYLGSVTKTVTCNIFMQLWEDGLIGLDDDVSDYFPFTIENPNYPGVAITPRMLMTHTSSILDDPTYIPEFLAAGDSTYSNEEFIQECLVPGGMYYTDNMWASWEPGTNRGYNQASFCVLGALAENLSAYSDSFELHSHYYYFDPLQMGDPSYIIGAVDTFNLAMPYEYTFSGDSLESLGYYSYPYYTAAYMKSTALGLGQHLVAFMLGGELGGIRVLEEATVDTMMKIQYPSISDFQGLGWVIDYDYFGREVWGHHGGAAGSKSEMRFCPAENSAVVVLGNGSWANGNFHYVVADCLFNYVEAVVSVEEEEGPAPEAVRIASISPSPFTTSTLITFELPGTSGTRLDVFDVSGRLVDTLIDDVMIAGEYSVAFDGGGLTSGVYFAVLRAAGESNTRRCVLIR